MKKADLLQAQLAFVREQKEVDESLFETSLNWFLEVERLQKMLKKLTETISGQPKGRFDMLRGLFLHPEGSMRPADLAMVAGMTRASSSHNLDVLERNGLIVRKTDPNDRRSARVSLTPEGRALMAEIMPRYLKAFETVVKSVSTPLSEKSIQNLKTYNAQIASMLGTLKESTD